MKDGQMSRCIVLQRPPRIADESIWAVSLGSLLLLLALLFSSIA